MNGIQVKIKWVIDNWKIIILEVEDKQDMNTGILKSEKRVDERVYYVDFRWLKSNIIKSKCPNPTFSKKRKRNNVE